MGSGIRPNLPARSDVRSIFRSQRQAEKPVLYEGTKTDKKGKWITAKELKVFDQVLLSGGTYAIIETIQIETLSVPETTYNFEAADVHIYYLGKGVLLPNMNGVDCGGGNKKLKKILDNPEKIQEYTMMRLNHLLKALIGVKVIRLEDAIKIDDFSSSCNKRSTICNPGQIHHFNGTAYRKVSAGIKGVFRFLHLK